MIYPIRSLGAKNVHEIQFAWKKLGQEFEILATADWHIDNTKCDRGLMTEQFQEAKRRGAGIIAIGDLFCAMQGKYDPRSSKSSLRPEHQVDNYIDALVDTTAEWLEPYSDNLLFISPGNHETSILKRCETDLIKRLANKLNTGVAVSGYGGYIKLVFYRTSDGKPSVKGRHDATSITIKTFHGYGGGGPVTKGTIQSFRQAVIYPDADIVISGHVHEKYIIEYPQERISNRGILSIRPQTHIRVATYKEEFQHDMGGWHVERGGGPKPLGGTWLNFEIKDQKTVKFTPYNA